MIDIFDKANAQVKAATDPQKPLNPQTNLPANNSTLDLNTLSAPAQQRSAYYGQGRFQLPTYSPMKDLASFAEYNVPASPYLDMFEKRAQNQSTAEKWGNGLLKAGVTTLGAVAENTLGILAGIGELATGGQYYNNFVGKTVDASNEYMQEAFPNFYTAAEMDPDRSLGDSMGTANFWADKVANGLGYTLGSIATIYLTGGMGPLMGTANAFSKGGQLMSNASRLARISAGGRQGLLALKSGKTLDSAVRGARIVKGAQMLEAGAMMSLAESSVEARETLKMARETLLERELAENPEYNSKADIPVERLRELENEAIAAGNIAFGLNMAVLSSTNVAMFGHLMRPGYQVAKKLPIVYSREAGEAVVQRMGQSLPGWMKKTGKAVGTVSPLLRNSAIEGLQEGSQFASSKAAILMAESNAFDGGTVDLIEGLSKGFAETFGTIEGIEQTAIGVIVGALGGSGGIASKIKERQNEQTRIDRVLELMSNDPLQDAINLVEDADTRAKIVNQLDESIKKGDAKAYNSLRDQLLTNLVNFHVNYGSFEAFKEQVKSVGDLSEDEFKKFFHMEGVELKDVGIASPTSYAQDLADKIDIARKRKEQIEELFPDPQAAPKSLRRTLQGATGKTAREAQSASLAVMKNYLYTMVVQSDFSAKRRENLSKDITEESKKAVERNPSATSKTGISKKALDEKVVEIIGPEGVQQKAATNLIEAQEAFEKDPNPDNFAKLIKAEKEFQTAIDSAMEAFITEQTGLTKENSPLEWESMATKVFDYASLSYSEIEANKTLSELFNDPAQREVFRQTLDQVRERKAEAKRKAKEQADIDKAKTRDEVDDTNPTTEEGKASKSSKRSKVSEEELEARKKFEAMTDDEFNDVVPENLSKVEKAAYEKVSRDKTGRTERLDVLVDQLAESFTAYQETAAEQDSDATHAAAGEVLRLVHQIQQNLLRKYPNQQFNPESVSKVAAIEDAIKQDGYEMGSNLTAEELDYNDVESGTYQEAKRTISDKDEFKTPDGKPKVTYVQSRPVMFTKEGKTEQIIPGQVHVVEYQEAPPKNKKDEKKDTKKPAKPAEKKDATEEFPNGTKVKVGKLSGVVKAKKGKDSYIVTLDGTKLDKTFRGGDLRKTEAAPTDPTKTKDENKSELNQFIGQEVTIKGGSRKGDTGVVTGLDPKDPYKKLLVTFEDGDVRSYTANFLGFETETNKTEAQLKDEAIRLLQAIAEANNSKIVLDEERNVYVNTETETGQEYARVTDFIDPESDATFILLSEIKDKIEVKNGKFTLDLRTLTADQKQRVQEIGKGKLLNIHASSIIGINMDAIVRDFFNGINMEYENYKRC
jgi:hypothetical protein